MGVLLVRVDLLDAVWHGSGDWPPSPFRLFQAMISGAFGGRWAAEDSAAREKSLTAFRWLETLDAPVIAAPVRSPARQVTSYVPNNDLDSMDGDPRRLEKIRAEKTLARTLLVSGCSFLYAWRFEACADEAEHLCHLTERLHTFGRGVDPAWACGEVLDHETAEARLRIHGGVARPSGASSGNLLACPADGSVVSLLGRYGASGKRLAPDLESGKLLFRQPPQAHYRQVNYERAPSRLLFEIRQQDDLQRFIPIPQDKTTALTEAVRDAAVARLSSASTSLAVVAERYLKGRGARAADVERRVRILPLPTIGHSHASPSIRRICVEVPPDCPIDVRDVQWAFLGLRVGDRATSAPLTKEVAVLIPAQSDDIAEHYGFDEPFIRWRSVTPVAVPAAQGSGRSGSARVRLEDRSASALVNALRHAGVSADIRELRIQREPFHARGAPADWFETPRFEGRLHHVEVVFSHGVCGPLVIGDGRFLGLGLLRPAQESRSGVHVLGVASSEALPISRHTEVTRALRRAIMARAQLLVGANEKLPLLFHGHESDGSPARGGRHEHIFFAAFAAGDGDRIDRLAVMAPAVCDRSVSSRMHLDTLARAVLELTTLKCGAEDEMSLQQLTAEFDEDLFGVGKVWKSYTAYRPTRYPKNADIQQSIERDLRTECARRALPAPTEVVVMSTSSGPRGGLEARVKLKFAAAVRGPLLLGLGSHLGQGLFRRAG